MIKAVELTVKSSDFGRVYPPTPSVGTIFPSAWAAKTVQRILQKVLTVMDAYNMVRAFSLYSMLNRSASQPRFCYCSELHRLMPR